MVYPIVVPLINLSTVRVYCGLCMVLHVLGLLQVALGGNLDSIHCNYRFLHLFSRKCANLIFLFPHPGQTQFSPNQVHLRPVLDLEFCIVKSVEMHIVIVFVSQRGSGNSLSSSCALNEQDKYYY